MVSFNSKVQSFGNNRFSNFNSNDSPLPDLRTVGTGGFDGFENFEDEDMSEFDGT